MRPTMMDWQRARHEVGELRERAYQRLITSALRRNETMRLASYYTPRSVAVRVYLHELIERYEQRA